METTDNFNPLSTSQMAIVVEAMGSMLVNATNSSYPSIGRA